MIAPFITALRTLTILPLPGPDTKDHAKSLSFFPVVGFGIGASCYLIAFGCSFIFDDNPIITGLIVSFVSIIITGALHLDGLADVADGFGGGQTKARILEIFKDSCHGTFGVLAIVFDIAARVLLVSWCVEKGHLQLLLVSVFFSRTVQAWGCSLIPYARPEGGTAEKFISTKPPVELLVITAGFAGIVLLGFGCMPLGTVLLTALVPVQLFFFSCLKKIGGITGDCLGAVNEIGELAVLLLGCIIYSI